MSEPIHPFEVEARLIYAMMVAGKSAKFVNNVMGRFHATGPGHMSPFDKIRFWRKHGSLMKALLSLRCGNYTKLFLGFSQLVDSGIDLMTCSPADLEKIHGIGPKTSRFFIIWIRPKENWAALDVHVLRWLRNLGYTEAPASTPPAGQVYDKWQIVFALEAEQRKMTMRELDIKIWEAGSQGKNVA